MANPATNQDRQKLIDFLDTVKTVIDEIIRARVILFREDLRGPLERAWVTSVRNTIEIVQNELRNPGPGLNDALGNAGLSEDELTFKLQGFQGAFDRFWRRGTVNLLDKLLKWINTILKSLIAAIPGAEAINEFKEAIENEIADDDPI
jgi:hypothetical protein